MAERVVLACVGAGRWGRNLVRVFDSLPDVELAVVCDVSEDIRRELKQQYPEVKVTADYGEVLANKQIQAVVLAVPAVDHYPAAKQALEAGKHVYVEKPISLSYDHARRLTELAESLSLVLMVGHLMEYHPALRLLKQLVDAGELGEILYLYSERVNLGVVRKDENALWSLAPHDISMILHLVDEQPESVPISPVTGPRDQWPAAPVHNGEAHWFKVAAQADGTFSVTNPRNEFTKTYRAGN